MTSTYDDCGAICLLRAVSGLLEATSGFKSLTKCLQLVPQYFMDFTVSKDKTFSFEYNQNLEELQV